MTLYRRLALSLTAFTVLVAALFALLAMGFAYTVEDRFIEQRLAAAAEPVRQAHARSGQWLLEPAWALPGVELSLRVQDLPADLAEVLATEPERREVAGREGRHYHVLALGPQRSPPWLWTEVSQQLVVRPMREGLFEWLFGVGALALAAALALALWLARRVARPLAALAAAASSATPEALPQALPGTERADEVGELARRLQALLLRTRGLITREQAFSRDASHELRTPLSVLRLGLSRLAARVSSASAQDVVPLLASVQHMEQVVATLLQLARESAPEPGTSHTLLLPIVEHWVLAHAQALDARGLVLDCHLNSNDGLPLPEPVLQLVLPSLLGNALAHASAGGTVTVSATAGECRIHNPGLGGPPGEGLGLVLVERLLERHAARLEFEQQEGATVVVVRSSSAT
jgi:signal transduction histidine kinase